MKWNFFNWKTKENLQAYKLYNPLLVYENRTVHPSFVQKLTEVYRFEIDQNFS
jgi:hypothetical protein